MAPLAAMPLDRLAEFAIEEKLIDRIDLAGAYVTIVQGETQFRFPDLHASTFLMGMLRGRSWYIDQPDGDDTIDWTSLAEHSPPVTIAPPEDTVGHRSIEATLQALLTMTKDIGIIADYRTNACDRTVTVDISACSSTFAYVEALAYLFDCVQHEIRSIIEAE